MNPHDRKVSRRQFMAKAAAVSALPIVAACEKAAKLPLGSTANNESPGSPAPKAFEDVMPKRTLGKTGLQVSMLGFGGGTKFTSLSTTTRELLIQRALDLGVNYFDTASEYQSEENFGAFLPGNREKMYIATKINSRYYDGARLEFERSLARLKTSYVDVLLVHCLPSNADLTIIENGVWKYINECKTAGTAKFIGFSTHDAIQKSIDFISNLNPDVALLPICVTGYNGIRTDVLPVANEKNVGVVSMLSLLGLVSASRTAEQLLAYVLNLTDANNNPRVASIIVGHDGGIPMLEENVCSIKKIAGIGCSTGVID